MPPVLNVHALPTLVAEGELADGLVVVIDVLRAATTITTALAAGCVARYQAAGANIDLIHRGMRDGYKAGALQAGLERAHGEFIAIFDADFLPQRDFLQQTIPYFVDDPDLGMVQTRWGHLNADYTPLTRAQAISLDKHFAIHGNRQGLSLGGVAIGWLAHILSEGDHRMNHVQGWAEQRLGTLRLGIGQPVRALDFSDDRLEIVLRALSDDSRWDRFEEALNRHLLKGSEIRPVVMAIEDLHWIDESSEERFKSLLGSISGARVFLIFTYRPEYVHTWGKKSYHSQVNLNRLSNRESLAMVAHLLGTEDMSSDLEELKKASFLIITFPRR